MLGVNANNVVKSACYFVVMLLPSVSISVVFAKGLIATTVLSMMLTSAVVLSNCVQHVTSKLLPPPVFTETCNGYTSHKLPLPLCVFLCVCATGRGLLVEPPLASPPAPSVAHG